MVRKKHNINRWLPFILLAGWLALVSPAAGGEIIEIGNFQVELLNIGESATGGKLTGYGLPGTITGNADWSAEQKQAVIRSITALNDCFANIAGRKVRVAIALRDDLPQGVLGNSGSTLIWDQAREHVTTTAEAAWRDGTEDDYFPGTADDIIQLSTTFPWHFGAGLPEPGTYDFQSVLVHEIVHGLGITTGNFRSDYGYYFGITQWDSLIRDLQGNVAAGGTTGYPNPMTLIGPEGTLYWTGANANATYGGNMPIFTDPKIDRPGSTLSHPAPAGELMSWSLNSMLLTRAPTKLVLDIFRDLGWSVNPDFYNAFGPTYYGDNETIVHQGQFVSNYDYAYGMYVNGDGNNITLNGVLEARGDFAKALLIGGIQYRLDITGSLQSTGDYSQALYAYGPMGLINHQGIIKADGIGSTGILMSAWRGGRILHSGFTAAGDGLAAIRLDNPYPQYGYSNSLHILNGSVIQGDIINTDPMQEAIISFGYTFDSDGTLLGVDPGFSFSFADDIVGNWHGHLGAGVTAFNGNTALNLLTVHPGATLGGNTTLTGDLVNYGDVAPGNSIGTITVTGDYLQGGGATLQMEIGGSASDRLLVGGDATFQDGSLLNIETVAPVLAGEFSLLSAGGSLSGAPQLTLGDSALLDFTLLSASEALTLQVDRTAYAAVGLSNNQQQLGAALDRLLPDVSGDLADVLVQIDALEQIASVRQALDGLTPTSYAALPDATFAAMRAFVAALPTPEGLPVANSEGWSSHAQLLAAQMRRDAADGVTGYRYDNRGFVAGADRSFGDYQLGVALSYQNLRIEHDASHSRSDSDGLFAVLRGALCRERGYLRGMLCYGHQWDDSRRDIRVADLARQATSHSQADMLLAGLEGGFDVPLGAFTLTPFVGLDYAVCFWGGFGEHDAGALNVKIDDTTAENLRSSLGVEFAAPLEFGSAFTLDTRLRLAWSHELGDDSYAYRAQMGGESFRVRGQDLGRDLLLAGLAVQSHVSEKFVLDVGFDYKRQRNNDGFCVQGGMTYLF